STPISGTRRLKYSPNSASQPGTPGRVISSAATNPPGIVTRRISARPAGKSARLRSRNAEVTQANVLSANGSASASAARSATRVAPRARSLSRASASMPSEISAADERVLVDQERHDRRPAEPVEQSEPGEPAEQRKRRRGERVVHTRGGEGGGDAEARGDGVEPLRAVHLDVLAGVDQVEARDPHRQGEPEDDRRRVERPADRDPAAGRRDPVGEAEDPVRRPREALGVRVAD